MLSPTTIRIAGGFVLVYVGKIEIAYACESLETERGERGWHVVRRRNGEYDVPIFVRTFVDATRELKRIERSERRAMLRRAKRGGA